MLVVEILLAAVVVFAVGAVAAGYGGSITHFSPDWPGRGLPEGRTLRRADVESVRFSLAFRGYRMSEVDAVLERLGREIAGRDARIEELTGLPYEAPPEPIPQPPAAYAGEPAADVSADVASTAAPSPFGDDVQPAP